MRHHENMVFQKADCIQDMHYADFAEDEVGFIEQINFGVRLIREEQSAALLAAIKEYEASKWKVIGQKVGKPAKVGDHYDTSETARHG